jgi:hypothetical protein
MYIERERQRERVRERERRGTECLDEQGGWDGGGR